MDYLEKILNYLSQIFTVLKRDERVAGEVAEKRDIKNRRRSKKVDLRNLKTDRKIKRAEKRLKKK